MLTVVTPASSFDLTVLATVKAELGIADRASDGMMRIRNNILVKKLLIFNIKSQSASILGTQIKGYR